MRIAITGHRPSKLNNDYDLISPLILGIKDKLQSVIDLKKPSLLITGMALGIDTLWANLAIENNIPFWACIPFKGHSSRWPEKSKKVYNKILSSDLCSVHHVSDGSFSRKAMQDRNEFMVDNSDLLVAVWDGSKGGTYNCVQYAELIDKEVLIINPKAV